MLVLSGNARSLHFARWNTSLGSFTAELYDELTPITANNFISLANSGFYNNLIFHRVVAGFVIQDGCPYGTGFGGPGWTIPLEIYPGLHHDQAGVLGMARSTDPNSAGSQYYITLAPQPHLDGNYAVFGKVVEGLDTVLAIGSVPTDSLAHPLTPVHIDTLRILDLAIGNLTPPNSTPYQCSVNEPQMFIVEALSQNLALEYAWYVDAVLQAGSADFIFEISFATPGAHTVVCHVSNDDWAHDVVWDVLAQGSELVDAVQPPSPILVISPNPFTGQASIKLQSELQGEFELGVFDLRGRLVRQAGRHLRQGEEWIWDGRDDLGSKVAPGIYLVRAQANGTVSSARCVVF